MDNIHVVHSWSPRELHRAWAVKTIQQAMLVALHTKGRLRDRAEEDLLTVAREIVETLSDDARVGQGSMMTEETFMMELSRLIFQWTSLYFRDALCG